MKSMNFYELLYRVLETYFDFLNEGKGESYAIAMASYEFENNENERILAKFIILTSFGEISINHKEVSRGSIERIREMYKKNSVIHFKDVLNSEELEEMVIRVKKWLDKFD